MKKNEMKGKPVAIFWFRRDLRLDDNAGLFHALKSEYPVVPVFIFDSNILNKLEDKKDKRLVFIHNTLTALNNELIKLGSSLTTYYDTPVAAWEKIIQDYHVCCVFANHDYEPYAQERDRQVEKLLAQKEIFFHTYKDQVIFEKGEVLKDDGSPYTVFTPYSRKWKSTLKEFYLKSYPSKKFFTNFLKHKPFKIMSLEEIGFENLQAVFPCSKVETSLIKLYGDTRNFPAMEATSRMSLHLRFGTVSIRKLASATMNVSEAYFNELIWREFYMMILWHFPHVVNNSFKKQYDRIEWRNNEKEFAAWCEGKTGYPIVDAGMRQLNETGFMHNRVRMITASFLTKHLLIDWRWGEAYFAKKLLDFELSSNNGGWQWAAGSGCDAAPYFRIFNPSEQTKKFDSDLKYIRKWVPEFEDFSYPKPIVEHSFARERCLATYKKYLVSSS